ncbi:MAG: NAD(P)/FAD-dependent oxidoreductase [Zavarzinella sp.]|nr:NAD(P)/FAD-dependent oxidoreductase [Zavarzinella sp.]
MSGRGYDAIVVGAGPNGLAAAVALAREGHSVLVLEAADTIGGGTRSAELTLPGFVHDVCSAIHPMAVASPFFRELPLADHGLEWVHPPLPLAHPLDDGSAAVLARSVEETAAALGPDERAYHKVFDPLVSGSEDLFRDLVGPFRFPRHPMLAAKFAWRGLRSGVGLANRFGTDAARALIAGLAGHGQIPLDMKPGAAIALMLGIAGHAVGWPLPRGGSQRIADALAGVLRKAGGQIETGRRVMSLGELPPSRTVLLDLTPRQVLAVAGDRLPKRYQKRLERYRYGMGVFKVDWALSGPIPWQADACRRAGTVHLGGTLEEICVSEHLTWAGTLPHRPFVLLAQPTLFDPSRAPAGKHTAWAYCHVPHASTADMTVPIEAQVERFAPGFRDLILAKHVMGPAEMERRNPNYVGGDINGGVQDLWQLFSRPVFSLDPYATPAEGVYICSSSTPPGGGVHGLCGYFAARSALRFLAKTTR